MQRNKKEKPETIEAQISELWDTVNNHILSELKMHRWLIGTIIALIGVVIALVAVAI